MKKRNSALARVPTVEIDSKMEAGEPTAVGRVQRRQKKTRIRLLKAGYGLITEKGIDETTIMEITDAADVGFGTFYNYFSSKDDIAMQILDCVVHALGVRSDAVNEANDVDDPVLTIANSVRLTAHAMMDDPMWKSWLKRTDLMVQRMRDVFKPFGIRDMQRAVDAGMYHIPNDNLESAWSLHIWLLTGKITDIAHGYCLPESEMQMCESIMRMMGVDKAKARAVSIVPLPDAPPLRIDFSYVHETEKGDE
ncbi:TetR/AcrR family transcriptional regulator [uncultured Cohaesibacter sp.]|uniref:TetR/AcrR family transcriptional regulator n=1 Tax=uncultured Cohaesibacter sp. TaxID=1002546 RepID=UPI0029300A29|nr:TetR/AcrR family transcriptional regulator [uncultured Cohaesibacter sp.]